MIDLNKFDEDIENLLKLPHKDNPIIFLGSSTFTCWGHENILTDLHATKNNYNIINYGFGGSTAIEAEHYYDKLIKPHNPRAIVYYEGDNDLPTGFSCEEVIDISKRILNKIRSDFGNIPVFVVSVKHCTSRKELIPEQKKLNEGLKKLTNEFENTYFVDMNKLLLKENREINTDLFNDDELHINSDGYKLLAKELLKEFKAHL